MYLYDTVSRQPLEIVSVDHATALAKLRLFSASTDEVITVPLRLLEHALRTPELVPLREAYVALLGKNATLRHARQLHFWEQLLAQELLGGIEPAPSKGLASGPRLGIAAYLDALRVLPGRQSPKTVVTSKRKAGKRHD